MGCRVLLQVFHTSLQMQPFRRCRLNIAWGIHNGKHFMCIIPSMQYNITYQTSVILQYTPIHYTTQHYLISKLHYPQFKVVYTPHHTTLVYLLTPAGQRVPFESLFVADAHKLLLLSAFPLKDRVVIKDCNNTCYYNIKYLVESQGI